MAEFNLLDFQRAVITAPAGCGKTQLIADSLLSLSGNKPVLILTHTNAGVTNLRLRMQRAGVNPSAYRLFTLDGYALRLVSMFPARSTIPAETLKLLTPRTDYPAIRQAACLLLQGGHINAAIQATYDRLVVDEYQDCNTIQHEFVVKLSELLPACVLGDPMQAIFGFRGNQLVDWDSQVVTYFQPSGELKQPWRWIRAGKPELGQWLLDCRLRLQNGLPIDLRSGYPDVIWVPLQRERAEHQRREAILTRPVTPQGEVLVIGDSRNPRGRMQLACSIPGATTVETVELSDLIEFGYAFDLSSPTSTHTLIDFAAQVMTQVGGAGLKKRTESLLRGSAVKAASEAENAVIQFASAPSFDRAAEVLSQLQRQNGARVYRPEVLYSCLRALRYASGGTCTFSEATLRERERNRHESRPIAKRAIGSTLLLKGLEAEVAVIPSVSGMDARHFYVAITRGSARLVICHDSPIIRFGSA